MGVVSSNHINLEMKNKCNITMHRDRTTKKEKHFYGHFNTDEHI